jgi:hypothetical protein
MLLSFHLKTEAVVAISLHLAIVTAIPQYLCLLNLLHTPFVAV